MMLCKLSLLTYKMVHEKQLVSFHSMLGTPLPSHSLRSNKGVSLLVPRVKNNKGARAFHSSINRSINQTSIAPISPAKPGSVARQPNQCSTAKSRKHFRNINRPWGVMVSNGRGEAKSKRCVFRYFLKVATELAEWTDSGGLFQRDGAQE